MPDIIDQSTEIDIDLGISAAPIDPSTIKEEKPKAKAAPNPMMEEFGEEAEEEIAEQEPKKSTYELRKEKEREFRETLTDIEKEAWDGGWRKGEFFKGVNKDGTPRPQISAEEWLERSEKLSPIANERARKASREKAETERENAELKKQIQELIQYNKTREERESKATQTQLEAAEEEAIKEGDIDRVKAIRRQINEVEKNKFTFTEPEQKQQPKISQDEVDIFRNWQATNSWFVTDPLLQAMADRMFDEITVKNPNLTTAEKLEKISEEVEQRFSDRINTYQRKPISVDSGRRGMQPNRAKTISYNDIPAEARQMCEGFIRKEKMNPERANKLRAEYVREYSI